MKESGAALNQRLPLLAVCFPLCFITSPCELIFSESFSSGHSRYSGCRGMPQGRYKLASARIPLGCFDFKPIYELIFFSVNGFHTMRRESGAQLSCLAQS